VSIIITYETLFDILRKESGREDLQEIPETFYADVHVFLDEKKAESHGNQRAAIEYENTQKIVRELYDRRERKLLLLALNKARTESAIIDPSILLPEERTLFDDLVEKLRANKKAVLATLTDSRASVTPTTPVASTPPAQEPVPADPVIEVTQSGEVVLPEPASETTGLRVTFLKAVPKFIGRDMTIFGPFDVGAQTQLPQDVVNVLLKKGHIRLLSTSS